MTGTAQVAALALAIIYKPSHLLCVHLCTQSYVHCIIMTVMVGLFSIHSFFKFDNSVGDEGAVTVSEAVKTTNLQTLE